MFMGLFSSLFGSGNKSAYDTSGLASAVNSSNDLYKQVYGDAISAGSPWLQLGQQGAAGLSSQLGDLTTPFSYDQFSADPSYQFLQDEAAKAVERSASAQGSLFAPSTAKALQDRATSLASTEYGNAFNRNQSQNESIYNMLMGVSDVGQNQAVQNAQSGWNYADAISGNNIGLQNAILGANQSKNANTQSMLGNWINLGGKLGAAALSDIRVKENVKKVGEKNGFNIYHFNYKGKPGLFEGVMAQEIAETRPDAVVDIDGVLRVYYDRIGIEMREVA
jgi:hypothetical protein